MSVIRSSSDKPYPPSAAPHFTTVLGMALSAALIAIWLFTIWEMPNANSSAHHHQRAAALGGAQIGEVRLTGQVDRDDGVSCRNGHIYSIAIAGKLFCL